MKNRYFKPNKLTMALAAVTCMGNWQVKAQEEQAVTLDEIVVTASRRSESLQDVPINIAAVNNEEIESLRLVGINEIARYVPGLTVIDRGPRDENPDIFVRGLNTTGLGPGFASDTVATYFGDVPLQVDFKPVDLERVEVLIGPQGTLYGQGTMGGAIRYIPKKADFNEYAFSARGGASQNSESESVSYETGVTVNIPLLTDKLALRANVDYLDDAGFIDYNFVVREGGVSNPQPNSADRDSNLRRVEDANGEETLSARVNLRWAAAEWLDVNAWYLYQDTEAEGRQIAHQLAFGTGPFESGLRYEEPNDFTDELFSLELEADLGFADANLVIGRTEYDEIGQRDQTDLLLNFQYGYEFFPTFSSFTRETAVEETDTVELRLTSNGDSALTWTVGYFYNDFEGDAVSEEFTPGFSQFAVDNFGGVQVRPDDLEYIQLTDTNVTEQALYGELTWNVTDSFAATFGYRRYEFEVDTTGGFGLPLFETVFNGESPTETIGFADLGTNQGEDDGNLFKLNLSYDLNDDNLFYFTFSEGYRNGGVNSVPECTPEQLASPNQQLCAQPNEVLIDPDTIDNYEIGYKGILFNNRLSTNLALYYIDWQDLQVSTTTALGSLPITGNGSEAESKGVEVQGRWLATDNLEVAFTYAYTTAELTERAPGLVGPFDALAGSRLPGHAENQGSLNLTYSTEAWGGNVDFNYGLVYFGDVFNIVGGNEDTLAAADGTPGDRGGEAIPSYDVHHLSVSYSRDNWSVQAYADNLWNEYYISGTRTTRRFLQNESSGPGNLINGFNLRTYGQFVGAPRTVGVKFTYDF
ncbi:MAG: TonB-dependent receptor [Acidiferrobacterales bacterium]|nr:TonB-dependent receptor [Acidiferrobacterales bacterium]